jgi:hypothetical protein
LHDELGRAAHRALALDSTQALAHVALGMALAAEAARDELGLPTR